MAVINLDFNINLMYADGKNQVHMSYKQFSHARLFVDVNGLCQNTVGEKVIQYIQKKTGEKMWALKQQQHKNESLPLLYSCTEPWEN